MVSISVRNLSLRYPVVVRRKSLRQELTAVFSRHVTNQNSDSQSPIVMVDALEDLSFKIVEGERVGLIGPNGAGKSSLLKVLGGIYQPSFGKIEVQGKTESLVDIGFGIDPEVSGIENIRFVLQLIGTFGEELEEAAADIAEFTELEDRLLLPVKTYSSGMSTRLSFSISTAMNPEILLIDEVIGTGDASFYQKAKARVERLRDTTKIMFLATHSDSLIKDWCNRVFWLENGRIIMDGSTDDVLSAYNESLATG